MAIAGLSTTVYEERASFFATGDTVTMMCWFFPTALPASGNYASLIGSWPGGNVGIAIHNVAGNSKVDIGSVGFDIDGTTNLAINTWYHTAGVRNGTTKRIYLNGAQENTSTNADAMGTGFTIGQDGNTSGRASGFTGRIAAIKVWKAELTAAEIANEMRQVLPMRTTNIAGFYPWLSTSDDEIDFSGNAATLTVTGSPTNADGPPIPWACGRRRLIIPAAVAVPSFIYRPQSRPFPFAPGSSGMSGQL
jgi:hypothetical protein